MGARDSQPGYKSAGAAAAHAPQHHEDGASTEPDQTKAENDNADAPRHHSSKNSAQETATTVPVDDMSLLQQMELEKSRYPGATTWAPEEAHLFEMLYLRQDLPILPAHWELDLRGVPISETNFADLKSPPVVYAHGKDFLGNTTAFPHTSSPCRDRNHR